MFHPLNWFSAITCIALQAVLFYKLKKPKSLKYFTVFMIVFTIGGLALRNNPLHYWDWLWSGRAIYSCWLLWSVADLCNMEQKCHWIWRIPAVGNAIVFFWYEPYSSWVTVQEMETFMAFGLWLALIMVLFDLIFVGLNSRYFRTLAGLATFLCLEIAAAVIEINLPQTKYPLMVSVLGLAAWLAILFLPDEEGDAHNPLLVPRL